MQSSLSSSTSSQSSTSSVSLPPAPPRRPIPTPPFVRWQRLQHRLVPVLAVALGAGAAWRLWREAPRVTAVGQVDVETADVRAPDAGEAANPPHDKADAPKLYDTVAPGQVLARVRRFGDGHLIDIAAPFGGQVVKIHFHPGQAVTGGERLFTLAGDRGVSITTYVRSDQAIRPEPGMAVDVRERSDSAKTFQAVIERVGPQYEPVPAAQLRDRKTEEWGLPVIITVPPDANLKPGELVYVGWHPSEPAAKHPVF